MASASTLRLTDTTARTTPVATTKAETQGGEGPDDHRDDRQEDGPLSRGVRRSGHVRHQGVDLGTHVGQVGDQLATCSGGAARDDSGEGLTVVGHRCRER